MQSINFTRASALNNIPDKKLNAELLSIENSKRSFLEINILKTAMLRYYESNIPIEYWRISMEKDFVGDPRLKQKYDEYTFDIKQSYISGKSIFLKGSHGVGKTSMTTCILKKAANKGYSCLYTTLGDIISIFTQASGQEKFLARRELLLVDFLVIDEVDSRFVATESASDLYARNLEGIFRIRSSNKLPTLMSTNSPNIVESFSGELKASLGSLIQGNMEEFAVFGNDFRKKNV